MTPHISTIFLSSGLCFANFSAALITSCFLRRVISLAVCDGRITHFACDDDAVDEGAMEVGGSAEERSKVLERGWYWR